METSYNSDSEEAFDRLVAELTSEDRADMLNKLTKNASPTVQLVEADKTKDYENVSLRIKYKSESVFYRFFLWIRSIFNKRTSEDIYNSDLLLNIAKQINREFPGIVNYHTKVLDSIFYDRLTSLKEAADFFKGYFSKIHDNPGDFYVFLSSVVAPEFYAKLCSVADPFTLSFETEPTNEVRNGLLKKLDDGLKNINADLKSSLYGAVCSVNWLEHFSKLPFMHFSSMFTNIIGDNFSCSYKNAREDFNVFAPIFANIPQIENNVLEAIFLFSSKKEAEQGESAEGVNTEDNLKEFLLMSNEYFSSIQMFVSSVPVVRLGKVINDSFDWMPAHIEGVEAWFKSFRGSARKFIDVRWGLWIIERRKNLLGIELKEDFKLSEFPLMKNRPWNQLWTRVPFTSELTGGFLSWFRDVYYDKLLAVLNIVIMEGIFNDSEDRSIYSEGLNSFVQSMVSIKDLQIALSSEGEFGNFFEENVDNKIRSFQLQSKIDSMISKIEVSIHDCVIKFVSGSKMMEKIFIDMFDVEKNTRQEVLQNFMSIKGLKNKEWRESLLKARKILNKCVYYISELESIETGKNV